MNVQSTAGFALRTRAHTQYGGPSTPSGYSRQARSHWRHQRVPRQRRSCQKPRSNRLEMSGATRRGTRRQRTAPASRSDLHARRTARSRAEAPSRPPVLAPLASSHHPAEPPWEGARDRAARVWGISAASRPAPGAGATSASSACRRPLSTDGRPGELTARLRARRHGKVLTSSGNETTINPVRMPRCRPATPGAPSTAATRSRGGG